MDRLVAFFRPLQFRGKARLADLLIPRSKRRALIFGLQFSLDTTDLIQRHMYAGSFERLESRVVQRLLDRGMTFVDVGANVGYYTALAAHIVGPTGMVWAFEPSDYAFPRLSEMIEVNGLSYVRATKCGLAETAGERVLYGGVEEDLFNNHTATMVPNENPNRTVVKVDTLDSVSERFSIKHIDVLKIDVDGLELQVLQGAKRLLSSGSIGAILTECSEDWSKAQDSSTQLVVDYLRTAGYDRVSRIGRSENYLFTR